jgi:hypothetical protein
MPLLLDIDLDNGKYTVRQNEKRLYALRYGEPWRDLLGDNLILYLAYEVESLRNQLGLDTKTGRPKEPNHENHSASDNLAPALSHDL